MANATEMKNKRRLVNVKSNIKGKAPSNLDITYGEIAVNYAKDAEFLSIKNEDQETVTFDRAVEYGKNTKDEANPSNNINYKSVALRGSQTRDNGSTSTAEYTSALGYEIQAMNKGEMGVGTFNKTKSGLLFSVGNGTTKDNRANVIEALSEGTVNVNGNFNAGNTNIDGKLTVNGDVKVEGNNFDVKSTTTNFSGTSFNVTGTTNFKGNTNTTGNTTINGNLTVTGTSNLQGATTLNSTLSVDGNTDLRNGLDVTGTTNLNGATNITGNTIINGSETITSDLNVSGKTNIKGATTLQSTLSVDGNTDLKNGLNVTGATNLNGATNITGATKITGDTLINGSETITSNLNVSGNTNIKGTLTVDGKTTINDDLDVTGNTNITGTTNISGTTTIDDNLNVTGNANITGNTNITGVTNISGTTTIDDNLNVTGNANITGATNIIGATTIKNNLTVTGNTNVSGTTTLNQLTVTGNTNLASVTAATLNVTGQTVLSSTTISGGLTITNGGITLPEGQGLNKTLSWSYGDVTSAPNGSTNFSANKSFVIPSSTAHITKSALTYAAGTFSSGSYDTTAARTINVPTSIEHLSSSWNSTSRVLTVGGKVSASTLTVTGDASLNAVTASTITTTGNITSQGSIFSTSDIRMKDNISDINTSELELLQQVKLKSFNYKDDETKRKVYGVIAQDIEAAGYTSLIHEDEQGTKSVDYTSFLILKIAQLEFLLNATRQQMNGLNAKIKELQDKE